MRARIAALSLAIGLGACTVSDDDLVGARCQPPTIPCGGTLVCNPSTLRCAKSVSSTGGGGGGGGGGGQGGGAQGGGTGGGTVSCTVQPFASVDEFAPAGCAGGQATSVVTISTPSPQVLVGGTLTGCAAGATIGQRAFNYADGGWTTTPDTHDGGRGDLLVYGMAASQGDRLFIAGSEDTAPTDGGTSVEPRWRVWSRSLGSAGPLELVDAPSDSAKGTATCIAAGATGRIFVAGVRDHALVVRRWDGGSWADAFVHTPPKNCAVEPNRIAVDPAGNLQLTGSQLSNSNPADAGCDAERPWFTMTLTNDGARWDGGFLQQAASGEPAYGTGITAAPDGTLFASAYTVPVITSLLAPRWLVRKSADRGQTWTDLDSWQLAPGRDCMPYALTATNDGVWVVGSCMDAVSSRHWVVRSWQNDVWTTADDWADESLPDSYAASVAVDSQKRIFVAGFAGGLVNPQWRVRSATCQ